MKDVSKRGIGISFNAPVVLTFSAICLIALLAGYLTKGRSTALLFSIYRSSPLNPLTYMRLFGHVFGHAGWEHFLNNVTMLLIIGPMLEERYGSKNMVLVIAVTALCTGLIHILLFSRTMLLGASGIVFAFILMAPMTGFKDRKIPLTFLLVAAFYLGGQIYQAVFVRDNISNLTHIVGGLVGATAGYAANTKARML